MLAPGAEILQAHINRNPNVRPAHGAKPRRHDAHDNVFLTIELEVFLHRVFPATEAPLPKAVAEDGYVVPPLLVFAREEGPANE